MRKLLCCLSAAMLVVLVAAEAFSAPPRGGRGRPVPAHRGPALGTPSHTVPPAHYVSNAPGQRPGWYANHPGSWWVTHPRRHHIRYATWAGVAGWVGLNAPVYYDYGYDGTEAVVTYPDDEDYTVNPFEGQPEYDFQAEQPNATWYPLGMFNLVPPGHTDGVAVLQLAIAKDGTVAGTYQDVLTDKIHQLHGTLNKQTQKITWTLDTNKSVVYETGLHNLIGQETSLMVNFGDNKKQKWTMKRMAFEQPEQDAGE